MTPEKTTESRTDAQLRFMFRCLMGEAKSPNVFVSIAKNGCKVATAAVHDLGLVRLVEQNKTKESPFAVAARGGLPIAWAMNATGYLGPVIYRQGEEITITDGPTLKRRLPDLVQASVLDRSPDFYRSVTGEAR